MGREAHRAPGAPEARPRLRWFDFLLLAVVASLLWSVWTLGTGMVAPLEISQQPLDQSLSSLPYYAGRTLLRMWMAFGLSLAFALATGYAAARNRRAGAVLLPLLDVLQSVPVLGFLSATAPIFLKLFPHSLLGMECASIFAIFTGQTWNLCFAFYQALRSLPPELEEATRVCRLSRWQRFSILELPAATNTLVWNAMLSFGGGWFFVVQSEALTVLHQRIQLPGLGSLMAVALETASTPKALQTIAAMLTVILATDQLVWRPLLDWSERFKLELSSGNPEARSAVYRLLQASRLREWLHAWVGRRRGGRHRIRFSKIIRTPLLTSVFHMFRWLCRIGAACLAAAVLLWALKGVPDFGFAVLRAIRTVDLPVLFRSSLLTLLRVLGMTVIATVVWVPVAVVLGQSRRATRVLQPLFEIAASFPVNMTFPFIVGFFVTHHVAMGWGSILLLALGPQWYVLFNVAGGAAAIPGDLHEAGRCYGLHGWNRWKLLLLPAIFPTWVTGACTAAGAAWNASIVAEVATWGSTTLRAEGLGSLVAEATEQNNGGALAAGVGMMAMLVVLMNKMLWRPLYSLAQRRFGFGT
jgi:NitT/TauT family transport system permease protein